MAMPILKTNLTAADFTPDKLLQLSEHLPPTNGSLSSERLVPKIKIASGPLAARLWINGEIDGIKDQITELLGKIDKPTDLVSPAEGSETIIKWTEAEAAAVYEACRVVMLGVKFPDEDIFWQEKGLKVYLLLVARAAAVAVLPPHRWLEFKTLHCLPREWMDRFSALSPTPHDRPLKLVPSAPPESPAQTEPVPAPTETPPEETEEIPFMQGLRAPITRVHWTQKQSDLFCLQLAHRLRKRNLNYLPQKNDRGGCRLMLEEARYILMEMPEEERKGIVNLSALLHDEHGHKGMKKRMLELMNKPRLPELPMQPRSASIPPIDPAPADEKPSGQLAVPAPEQKPAPVSADPLAGFRQVLEAVGRIDKLEQRLGETEEMNNLLTEELDRVRGRCDSLEASRNELLQEVTELKAIKTDTAPRIAVVGCKEYEFNEITKRAVARGLHARFRWYDQDKHPTDVHADYALIMKWASHAWQDKIMKNGIPRGNWAFIDGSADKAVKQMEVWIGDNVDAAVQ